MADRTLTQKMILRGGCFRPADYKILRADIMTLSNEELATIKQWVEDELIRRVLDDDSWDAPEALDVPDSSEGE